MTKTDQRMSFALEEEDYTIVFQSNGLTTDAILEHFIMFMKGCGYHNDSIYSSMHEVSEEYLSSSLQQNKLI